MGATCVMFLLLVSIFSASHISSSYNNIYTSSEIDAPDEIEVVSDVTSEPFQIRVEIGEEGSYYLAMDLDGLELDDMKLEYYFARDLPPRWIEIEEWSKEVDDYGLLGPLELEESTEEYVDFRVKMKPDTVGEYTWTLDLYEVGFLGIKEKMNVSVVDHHQLSIYTEGEGMVEVDGELVEDGWSGAYSHGDTVELSAVPGEGHDFIQWSGDIDETDREIVFDITENMDITAHFEIKTYELNIYEEGEGSISVDPIKDEYEHGMEVNLKAQPEEGWEFSRWSGDHDSVERDINISITSDMEITAHFMKESNFIIELIDYDEEMTLGDTLDLKYRVNNTGDIEGTQTIEFRVDGELVDSIEITLEADEIHEGVFQWTSEEPGTYDISIYSEDDEVEIFDAFTVEEKDEPGRTWVIALIVGIAIAVLLIWLVNNKSGINDDR